MTTFESLHQSEILGSLTMFDRLIFKGHLTRFFPDGAFARFLYRQGVLLKDFKPFVRQATAEIMAHLRALANEAGRRFRYLEKATTKAQGQSKEDFAREIAAEEGIDEGLVCILRVVEPCRAFTVVPNRETHRLEAVLRYRKCLHYYIYQIDPEFGWMHVRLQSWFPFPVQIYINGREWLSRQLDHRGIAYERYENSFLRIEDLATAQKLCDKFTHRKMARVLSRWASPMNPWFRRIRRLGFGSHYWVLDQCETATDVMFRDRARLERILPDLLEHASLHFSAEDILGFLGRKLHGNFEGQVTTDLKKRPQGWRVKHTMKRNSLKLYDKWSVLRTETTINNPREFKVLKTISTPEGLKRRWSPMCKGVANLWRYAQVSRQSNARYLEALAQVKAKGEVVHELDLLCRSRIVDGKRFAKFNPVRPQEARLFQAVLVGEHLINGFRNRDLAVRLYPDLLDRVEEKRRRCARVSRLIGKLRGHGLIAKVKDSRLYRVTKRGHRTMGAVLRFRGVDFPAAYQAV